MVRSIDAYLPYVDRQPAGLQRFAAHLLNALREEGLSINLFVAQLQESVEWVEGLQTQIVFKPHPRSRFMQHLKRIQRVCWLQFVYPISRLRRGVRAPLLALAHESAPLPMWPQVSVAHDLTAFKSFSGPLGVFRRLQHWCWISGLRRSRWIVCVSDRTRQDLLSQCPELTSRVVTIHEGVNRRDFSEQPEADDGVIKSRYGVTNRYLLYAGTLAVHKNVEFLLPVLGDLRSRYPDLSLVLVGKHDRFAKQRLQRIAAEHGISGSVIVPGFVADHDLAALMRQCDAFVFPSLNEGFGLAPVEAMSCGASVVASSAGSLPEVILDGGLVMSPTDREAWVEALTTVLGDSSARLQLRARALARASALSWTAAAKNYLPLLEQKGTPMSNGHSRDSLTARRRLTI